MLLSFFWVLGEGDFSLFARGTHRSLLRISPTLLPPLSPYYSTSRVPNHYRKKQCLSISAFGTVVNNPRRRLDRLSRLLRQSFAGYPTHPARAVSGECWIQQGSPAGHFPAVLRPVCSSSGPREMPFRTREKEGEHKEGRATDFRLG